MKRVFFEFNSIGTIAHSFSIPLRKGMADAYWTNHFFTDPGFPAQIRVQEMRSAVSGQLPDPKILLLRSVPLYGLCPTHLPRKPPRYRNLPAGSTAQTLSCRHPQPNRAQYFGRSQRKQRLVFCGREVFFLSSQRNSVPYPGSGSGEYSVGGRLGANYLPA